MFYAEQKDRYFMKQIEDVVQILQFSDNIMKKNTNNLERNKVAEPVAEKR